jgi:VIT family protein
VPQTPHIERHFASSEAVRDIVIGMSDGLTVPFALAAGLSGRLESSSLIVVVGLARSIFTEGIMMVAAGHDPNVAQARDRSRGCGGHR